jgi:hypothetical protein
VAALLSVAGVLVAGSAAAIVNTQVLGGASTSSAGAPATSPATLAPASTGAVTTVATTSATTAPGTTTPPPASTGTVPPAATTSATPPGPPPTAGPPPTGPAQGTYQLGPGGSVTLAAQGDVLTVVAVHPAPGWEVHDAENTSPSSVRVRVRNDDGGDVRLDASLVLGVISTSLEVDGDRD